MDIQQQHLDYLFRSLQHHPSPYIIYELDGSIRWANIAARYILRIEDLSDLSIKVPEDKNECTVYVPQVVTVQPDGEL